MYRLLTCYSSRLVAQSGGWAVLGPQLEGGLVHQWMVSTTCVHHSRSGLSHLWFCWGKKEPRRDLTLWAPRSRYKFSRLTSIHYFWEHLREFGLRSKGSPFSYQFSNSHNPHYWWSADVVRRKLTLVTFGTKRVNTGFVQIFGSRI